MNKKSYLATTVVYSDGKASETVLDINHFNNADSDIVEEMIYDKVDFLDSYGSPDTVFYYIVHYEIVYGEKVILNQVYRNLLIPESLSFI